MPLDEPKRDIPSIVPINNLRLPDALTVAHGPARMLSRFVLQGDNAVRQMGISLRIRHDFGELAYVNQRAVANSSWVPLVHMFNPDYSDLHPDNSYWLSGENDGGEIVLTGAFRVFHWPHSSLAAEAGHYFCDRHGRPRHCIVTAPAAPTITGVVFWGGSLWVRPDHRRRHLSELVGRLGRAFGAARWPIDWLMCLVMPVLAEKGVAIGYGYKHLSRSIRFPDSPLGDLDLVVAYLSADEAYADFAEVLSGKLSNEEYFSSSDSDASRLESMVTRISSDPVVHGSINLS
jgi:hypothetical protein